MAISGMQKLETRIERVGISDLRYSVGRVITGEGTFLTLATTYFKSEDGGVIVFTEAQMQSMGEAWLCEVQKAWAKNHVPMPIS